MLEAEERTRRLRMNSDLVKEPRIDRGEWEELERLIEQRRDMVEGTAGTRRRKNCERRK